jgi:hypothetical protein
LEEKKEEVISPGEEKTEKNLKIKLEKMESKET